MSPSGALRQICTHLLRWQSFEWLEQSASFPRKPQITRSFDAGPALAPPRTMLTDEPIRLLHREITDRIIRGFYDTYNELGPGFPEFVCGSALAIALRDLGLDVGEEVHLPVWFRGRRIATFRADMLVEGVVIVEVKAQHHFERFHYTQVVHYLKAAGLSVGLLMNFGRHPEFKRIVFEQAKKANPAASPGDALSDKPLPTADPSSGDVQVT